MPTTTYTNPAPGDPYPDVTISAHDGSWSETFSFRPEIQGLLLVRLAIAGSAAQLTVDMIGAALRDDDGPDPENPRDKSSIERFDLLATDPKRTVHVSILDQLASDLSRHYMRRPTTPPT